MKLLFENWRKYLNERPEHRRRQRQREIEGMEIDGLRAELTRAQEFLAKVKEHAKTLPEKPDEKDEEASHAYFVSHRKARELKNKYLDSHYERVDKLGDYWDGPAKDAFMDAVQAMEDGTGSREEMRQKKEAWKDALSAYTNATLELRKVMINIFNKAKEAGLQLPRDFLDGETGLIKWLEMDVKYVARNLRSAYDAEQRGY